MYPTGVRAARLDRRPARFLLPVLVPASWIYQSLSNAVRSARSADVGEAPEGVRVVSVGNLEVGGSGKTPLAMYLIEAVAAAGGKPVYISRGFGGVCERLDVATVVPGTNTVAPGPARGVRYLGRRAPRLTAQIGDEGAMVAHRLPDVPLVFCRDKRRALDVAAEFCSPTHAVLDDAFQSWGVPRDVDIVLVDGERPLGGRWLLPAGRLREPPEALERSDFVGVNGVEDDVQLDRVGNALKSIGIRKPLFGIRRRTVVVPADPNVPSETDEPSAALSAIGRAEAFERQVAAAVSGLSLSFRFPDHHRYDRRDVDWILEEAGRRGIERLVTTEKDWVKLAELDPPRNRFTVARLALELFGADPISRIQKAAD